MSIRIYFLILLTSGALVFAADPLAKYREGIKRFEAAEYGDAQKTLNTFMAENPYEPEVKKALYYIAVAAAAEGHCHEAITRANIAIERYPLHPDRVELKVLTGECLYKVDAFARAEKVLGEAAKQAKTDLLQYRIEKTLGFLHYDARRPLRAGGHLKIALKLSERLKLSGDDQFRILKTLGKIYAEDPLQTEAAVGYLQSAIGIAEGQKREELQSLRVLLRKISLRRVDKLNGLPDNSIADIRVDGDDVYVATWGAGMVRYVRSQDRLEKIRLPSPQLRGIYADFDDIYVTSFDGVYRIIKKSGKIETLSDAAGELKLGQKAIKDDRHVYFSTLQRGLIQYDTIKKKILTLGKDSWVGSNQVYAIDADVEYVAVGTLDQGAVIRHKASGEIIRITVGESGLRSENIKAIQLDGRYVHIGAHNDGVYTYDLQLKSLKRLDLEIPFPSAFARRDHELFIGTSGQGVRILNRNDMRVEKLSAAEGLSSNEVHVLRVEGDFIWIGYLENGIDVVYKPTDKKNN